MFIVMLPKNQPGADGAVLNLADAFHTHGSPDRTLTEQYDVARYLVETATDRFEFEIHMTEASAYGI